MADIRNRVRAGEQVLGAMMFEFFSPGGFFDTFLGKHFVDLRFGQLFAKHPAQHAANVFSPLVKQSPDGVVKELAVDDL